VPHGKRSHPDKPTQLEAVLSAGRVVTCLIDDNQVLNEDDNGTCGTVRDTWRSLFPDAPVVHLDLSEQHRVPESYASWLEDLLAGRPRPVPSDYDFRVASSEREVVDYLRSRSREVMECPDSHSEHPQCGLLASYTVCDGRPRRNGQGRDDLRVPAMGIRWLMDKEEYDLWWRDPVRRHKFDRCASVYGCQGFELDYAGVFWGRDLSLRMKDGHIELDLCRPHDIKDNIATAYGRKFYKLADLASKPGQEEVLRSVITRLANRYRILLSRGRYGTIVHCEDHETAKALRTCLHAP
jgi:hypothetical protein